MGRGAEGARRRVRVRSLAGALGLLLTLVLGMALPVVAQQRADVLPRFEDKLVTTVDPFTTDLAWLGDDLLIVALDGIIYRLPGAKAQAKPEVLLDLSNKTGTGREQGMVGVVADPRFSKTKHRFLYVFYTRDDGGCSNTFANPPNPDKCFNRLSRFSVPGNGKIDSASEKPLIKKIDVGIPNHNSGDLAFGNDGMLYVTTGDGGADSKGGPGKAQQLNNLHGKILRLRTNGRAPADNPFANKGDGSVACAKRNSGTAPKGKRCAEIFAFGLRNPYRFAFDPNTNDTRFYINDVGEETWEEIDLAKAGANYGWPLREGPCKTNEEQNCKGTNPKKFEAPVYAYNHSTGCHSITGGAVVPNSSDWGAAYRGAYIYGDFICKQIFSLTQKGQRFTSTEFAVGEPFAQTAMIFDTKQGNTLYYNQNTNHGAEIRAIQRKD